MVLEQWISDAENCAAVLLSGGRDSLLAAAISVEDGNRVVPVICDNGHMEGIERAKYAVNALQEVYGTERVFDLVVRKTGFSLLMYLKDTWQATASSVSEKYPNLQMYQVHCLACKTVMYVSLLQFCEQHDISILVDGVRRSQGFFVDLDEMHDRYGMLCHRYGVVLSTPVYDLVDDLMRKRMLNERGLPTKTLEPQCFLGCPMPGPLNRYELESLGDFFAKELMPIVDKELGRRS